MTTLARFTRGSNKIDLDEVTYYLGDDFKPPNPEREFNMASGTSLNRSGGASLVGTRALNRDVDFTVNVKGTTEAACIASARRLASFVMAGGDLFFELQLYPGLPEPLWGQFGSWLKYEVVTAIAKVNERYGNFGASASVHAQVVISLQVKPYAVGNKQRLINAAGYVFENNYGSVTGEALGLSIHTATINKMTNPVFGHATFGNGWTAAAGLIVTKNTDPRYCLPGLLQSARIVASSTNVYYQSIAAGNTNKHTFTAWVKRPDGAAVTVADCAIYYNATKASTYTHEGGGIYRVQAANIDGIAAAALPGLTVEAGRTVYLMGYQMEEIAIGSPLAYGDLLGCAWTSTAHASTSTRAATNINVTRSDDFILLEQGAVSLVWKPYNASTYGTSQVLFGLHKSDYTANGIYAFYDQSTDTFNLTDGTNTVTTAAQTFAAGDTLYLTFTWGVGGLNIYKSGANAATGATYTPASTTNQAIFAIGQVNAGVIANGDILGFDVYPTEITSTQAAALYTAQAALVAGGKRVSTIPWLWTKDGDGVVDNCNDSTRDNFCVVGGVPGSEQAVTAYHITPSVTTKSAYWLVCSQEDVFTLPYGQNYYDLNASADATCSGGGYSSLATDATNSDPDPFNYSVDVPNRFNGKAHCFGRIAHTTGSGTFYIAPWYKYSSGSTIESIQKLLDFAAANTFYGFYLGQIDLSVAKNNKATYSTLRLGVAVDWVSATGVMRFDYLMFLQGSAIKIYGGDGGTKIVVEENTGYRSTSNGDFYDSVSLFGDVPMNVYPGKLNIIWFISGDDAEANVITQTGTFEIYTTPRWSLL